MKILLTGAFNWSNEQIIEIEKIGHTCMFIKDEKNAIENDIKSVEAIICNGFFLYHNIEDFPNLKYIQLTSAGLDRVPLDYIKKHNIDLYNARGVYSIPMAEWTILKILEIYKNSRGFYEAQFEKIWKKNRGLLELYGKTATIVGYGSVGKEIAKRLKAFDVIINVVDVIEKKDEYIDRFTYIKDMDDILRNTDILILTLPLTKETEGIINNEKLKAMKNDSIIINISRGKIINEKDLIYMLKEGKFKGIALDVFEEEPLNLNSELWDFKNVIITPHNSFVGENNNRRMFEVMKNNLINYKKEE